MPSRIASIDIFRALTMLLMLFVNMLGFVEGVPDWLGHSPRNVDAMGLADIVFPLFLFIIGMSIPFAVKSRLKKEESRIKIMLHVIIRSIALLIMGVFHENVYHLNPELSGMSSTVWQLLTNVAFVLIWNVYPGNKPKLKWIFKSLQAIGIISLIILALIFQGGESSNPFVFKPHWWGILGLIGWTYMICTFIYLFSKKGIVSVVLIFLVFVAYNILIHADVINLPPVLNIIMDFLGNGALASLTMGGVLASLIFIWAKENDKLRQFFIVLLSISAIMFFSGVSTRQFGGISKLNDTPAWVFFSLAASFSFFCLLFWLTDVKSHKKVFNIVKPAGTSTLLCYIIPYIFQPLVEMSGLNLPAFFNYGAIGLIKLFIVSLLIISLTGLLERVGIKMKL